MAQTSAAVAVYATHDQADEAIKSLQKRDYFTHYTEQTRRVADGKVDVLQVEVVAETRRLA